MDQDPGHGFQIIRMAGRIRHIFRQYVEAVEQYIATQEEHHRKTTFQDEYRAFLKKHGIEWDERYVWD
jgi:hypothetical protein